MENQENRQFTYADCSETGYDMPLTNKVIVIRQELLPAEHPSPLFLCTGGFGADANPNGRAVYAVSLSTGEHCRWNRGDVVGVLKPELLPDEARLYLSQVRPGGARDVTDPEYSGYCFLENGRYSSGVWLRDANEAVEFMQMQAPYQHRVLLTDRDDFAVAEMIGGELVYPTREELDALRQGGQEQSGGMTMT